MISCCISFYLNFNPPSPFLFEFLRCPSDAQTLWDSYCLLESKLGPDIEACTLLAAGVTSGEERFDKLKKIIDGMSPIEASNVCINILIPSLQYTTQFSRKNITLIVLSIITTNAREFVKVDSFEVGWFRILKVAATDVIAIDESIHAAEILMQLMKDNREFTRLTKGAIAAFPGHESDDFEPLTEEQWQHATEGENMGGRKGFSRFLSRFIRSVLSTV